MKESDEFPITQETLDLLFSKISEINENLRNELKLLFEAEKSKKILFKLTSIHYSLINRTIETNNGYITLFNCKNYICAITLLRIQVENCLRLYGFTIMDDKGNAIDKFINGEEYKNLTGNNGKKLYDSYLAREIDKKMPGYNFAKTYKQYCEIIHFSSFYQAINNELEHKKSGLSASLYLGGGQNMPHFDMLNKIEYTKSLLYSTILIYKLFEEYRKMIQKVLIKY